MRTFFIASALLLIAAAPPVTSSNFEDKVLKQKDKVVVVDFEAEWCGPCHQMKPIFESLIKKHKDVDFFSVNVDTEQELIARHRISSIPATLIFVNGKKITHRVGLASESQLTEAIQRAKSTLRR